MKKVLLSIIALAFCGSAMAQVWSLDGKWAAFSTKVSSNLAYATVPAGAVCSGVQAQCDDANGSGTLTIWYPTANDYTRITNAASAAATNIGVADFTKFIQGTKALIRDVSADKYQYVEILNTNASSLYLSNAAGAASAGLDFAVEAGDIVYALDNSVALYSAMGSSTITLTGSPLFVAPAGVPLCLVVDSVGDGALTNIYINAFGTR